MLFRIRHESSSITRWICSLCRPDRAERVPAIPLTAGTHCVRSGLQTVLIVTLILLSPAALRADDLLVPAAPSFRYDVMPVLSRSGCSLGTCHGNQNGKGGLKISLRGQDPDIDFITLTRQLGARRVNVLMPDDSLLLRKPLMDVPHEGGRRFNITDHEYQILRAWIAAGMPADSASAPQLTELSVTPDRKTLYAPEAKVDLKAMANFSDGSSRDVTHLAVFESSDPAVVVSSRGAVEFHDLNTSRQTSITVRYLNQQQPVRIEFVPARDGFVFTAPPSDNIIDKAVFAQLERLKINPAPISDDVTFLRRVYLDLTGLLPTAQQAKSFLASSETDKRAKLIDQLLASTEFTDFQTLRWADLLRVEDKTLDSKGVEVYYHWIRDSVAQDKPLNQFASEIIAARGSTYTEPAANFYRALRLRKNELNPPHRCFWVFDFNARSVTIIRSTAGLRTTTTAGPISSRESITRSSKTVAAMRMTSMSSSVSRSL